jgi:hypothetical protein
MVVTAASAALSLSKRIVPIFIAIDLLRIRG